MEIGDKERAVEMARINKEEDEDGEMSFAGMDSKASLAGMDLGRLQRDGLTIRPTLSLYEASDLIQGELADAEASTMGWKKWGRYLRNQPILLSRTEWQNFTETINNGCQLGFVTEPEADVSEGAQLG